MDVNNGGDRDANNNLLSSSPPRDLTQDGGHHPKGSGGLMYPKNIGNIDKSVMRTESKCGVINSETPSSPGVVVVVKMGKKLSPSSTTSMPVLCSILGILALFPTLISGLSPNSGGNLLNLGQSGEQFGHNSREGPFTNLSPKSRILFPENDYREEPLSGRGLELENGEENLSLELGNGVQDPPSSRTGRVLSSGVASNSSQEVKSDLRSHPGQNNDTFLTSASSEENGSSRKAAPDVQDIIDGIVKLLGGKVHNGTPPQGQGQGQQGHRPLSSPNPYNLFNPTKPYFPKISYPPTAKPSRINNRGPVLPGQGLSPEGPSSFEAIPIEALSEFDLNKGSNFGPPFPISGSGGQNIQPNGGGVYGGAGNGGNRVLEPPYKQGVPLPEMVVPQHGYPLGQGQNQGQGQGHRGQNQQQQQPHGVFNQQPHPQSQNRPVSHPGYPGQGPTRYQVGNGNGGSTQYNPFGFEHPNTTPFNKPSNPGAPTPTNLGQGPPTPSKRPGRPVIKFPTDGHNLEDDEADEARFTTPKGSSSSPPTPDIRPTLSSSLGQNSPSGGVYPTLLLSTNKENGLVELVTEFTSNSEGGGVVPSSTKIQPSTSTAPNQASQIPSGIKPIFYPNNSNRGGGSGGLTTPTSGQGQGSHSGVSSSSTPVKATPTTPNGFGSPMNIHSLPTPPLRPGIVISDSPSQGHPHPPPASGVGVGSVEVVTAEDGQSLLASGVGGQIGDIFDVTVTAQQNYGGASTVKVSPFQIPGPPSSSQDDNDHELDLLTAPKGTEQFVSIDGKRTYFNLHPSTAISPLGVAPTRPMATVIGTSAPLPGSSPVTPATSATSSPSKNIGVGSVGAPVPLLPQPPGKTLFNSGTPIRSSPVSTSLSISGGGSGSGTSGNEKGIISKTPPNIIRRPLTRRPSTPPVRIDTCIVGDDSTCNSEAFEVCRTENGVSSCVCRAGFARRRHREPCKAILSLVLSIKLDKLGDKKLSYNPDYFNPSSETYQTIEWETIHALDATLAETILSPSYVGSKLDAIGFDGKHAVVNTTILLQEVGVGKLQLNPVQLKKELQKQLIQVLTRHRNNFGKSQLWVEGPISAVSAISDVNECEDSEQNDCSSKAVCVNTFGSFECRCEPGYGDPWETDKRRSGRRCDSCSGKNHCNGRGECLIENGHKVCKCNGNYYGSQCDIDGEVLAVAIGASVSAVVIIGLTLACLCMWSRKWKKEEQKAALMSRTLFGGMANQALSYLGGQKTNPYQQHVSMDERLRWAQVAEGNMSGNIYVQNDPMSMPPGCGMGPQLLDTPPMMARRSAETIDTTLDGDLFDDRGGGGPSTKRPRSRASQFQGGSIYYDLEPDQTEIYASRSMMHFPPPPAQFCVPMTAMGHYATTSQQQQQQQLQQQLQHQQQYSRGGFYS